MNKTEMIEKATKSAWTRAANGGGGFDARKLEAVITAGTIPNGAVIAMMAGKPLVYHADRVDQMSDESSKASVVKSMPLTDALRADALVRYAVKESYVGSHVGV